jgi:hypothetical protein
MVMVARAFAQPGVGLEVAVEVQTRVRRRPLRAVALCRPLESSRIAKGSYQRELAMQQHIFNDRFRQI